MASLILNAISREWRSRADAGHDYAGVKGAPSFRAGFGDSGVPESEFLSARIRLERLLAEYEGQTLLDILPGVERETVEGSCYEIRSRESVRVPAADRDAVRKRLQSELTLVYGIGRGIERQLRRKGCRSIGDLLQHRRFADRARSCLDTIRDGDAKEVIQLVGKWHSPSHPLVLLASALFDRGDFVFLDIETLGIFSRPVVLIGLATESGGSLEISQFLLRGIDEELPALLAASVHLHQDAVIVTYNGKCFDIPHLQSRYAFYGEHASITHLHFDLLHAARRNYRTSVRDCRLATVEEEILGIGRCDDVPGGMVPEFYETYLRTGNPGPLLPIVAHNRQDIVSLAHLFCRLREAAYGS
jgi:uncharacterized protein YprB with RNaseH-like and TPR domain